MKRRNYLILHEDGGVTFKSASRWSEKWINSGDQWREITNTLANRCQLRAAVRTLEDDAKTKGTLSVPVSGSVAFQRCDHAER